MHTKDVSSYLVNDEIAFKVPTNFHTCLSLDKFIGFESVRSIHITFCHDVCIRSSDTLGLGEVDDLSIAGGLDFGIMKCELMIDFTGKKHEKKMK